MLQFKTLGWRKEDETSPNNILLNRHNGVDGFFRYLALRSLYGKKLSTVMMRPWVKFFNFCVFYGFFGCYDGLLCPPSYGA